MWYVESIEEMINVYKILIGNHERKYSELFFAFCFLSFAWLTLPILRTEVVDSSEMSVNFHRTTRRHIPITVTFLVL